MKKKHTLTLILLLAALTLAAQSNYSPCYTNNMSKGDAAYKQGKYNEAKTYYVNAKQCAGGNPTAAQQKIAACDAKIKAQKEAAEAKRKAEAEAAEAKRRAEAEAAEAKRRAEAEAAEAKRKAEEEAAIRARGYQDFTVNGIAFKMIYVEGGTFTMGCTSEQGGNCDSDEKPIHSVTLSDFLIGETEVTQALWKAVMGTEPSYNGDWEDKYGRGSAYPAYRVSWNEAVEFCNKLNEKLWSQLPSGYRFALPTEAQWEYAARGGNKSRGYKYSGSNTIGNVAWHTDNSGGSTHPVKGKQANELGLFDMSGNVWEWCQDWYSNDYYSVSPSKSPGGPSSGSGRVLRGGGWYNSARRCRVSERYYDGPGYHVSTIGFRLSLVHQ